jgi:group II intron reverse transcriptase/maturase
MIKPKEPVETRLQRIRSRSEADSEATFRHLISHVDEKMLKDCFNSLKGNKAVGIDGVSKSDYEDRLDENITNLLVRMKTFSYRPGPVREVFIPKSDGGRRPLGISSIEDKIVQKAFARILESIYEPIFTEQSFGFRRGRKPQDAIKSIYQDLWKTRNGYVLDLDIRNYFGQINQQQLVGLLRIKIKDEVFIRYIVRMFKSGIFSEDGGLRISDQGTPQGSIVSPILANIYGHYVLDKWVSKEVVPRVNGLKYYRYCDDCILHFSRREDGPRLMRALEGRLYQYGLEMSQTKTRQVNFTRSRKAQSFDFLGFTFYVGQSKKGHWIPKLKTSGKRRRMQLSRISAWCREHRCRYRLLPLWRKFCQKVQGTINYYAVSWNIRNIASFVHISEQIFFKWINRRSQKRSLDWHQFAKFKQKHAYTRPRLMYKLHE